MQLIEHERLPGNLYFVVRGDEISGFSAEFVQKLEQVFQTKPEVTSLLAYEETHAEGPLYSVSPMAMNVGRVDDWLDEAVEIFADTRGFFLEDHEAEKVAE